MGYPHTHTKESISMACKMPHTAEEFQRFVKAEAEGSDRDRQKAIVGIIKRFEFMKELKREDMEHYARCPDVSDDRRRVIDQFLQDEYRKDAAVIESLWDCVSQIQAQIYNKVRWSYEENFGVARVGQPQQQQLPPQQHRPPQQQGASSSCSSSVVVQQQQLPHLDDFQPSFEENVAVADGGWTSDMERELSRLETQWEEEKLASFDPYDDGYDSNNSQTWDHPDYR